MALRMPKIWQNRLIQTSYDKQNDHEVHLRVTYSTTPQVQNPSKTSELLSYPVNIVIIKFLHSTMTSQILKILVTKSECRIKYVS